MKETDRELLEKISAEINDELLDNILPYWINHVIDYENGGFFGRITFDNVPVPEEEKGSLLAARILWTFSACYKKYGLQEFKDTADHAYSFLKNSCWDRENGGIYWMVTFDGKPKDTRKLVYGQAFGIYALSEYYSATKNNDALDLAVELYSILEEKCADQINGGYYEAFNRDWQVMDDARLSKKDHNEPKSMNTHLHLLEAYTNLYRSWKSKELKYKLSELIDLFSEHIINDEGTATIAFLTEDWIPRSDVISYGHDIESSWLLIEAAEVMGDSKRYQSLKKISLGLAHNVRASGLDRDGGIFNEGGPAGVSDDSKDWWPQAEALIGFVNAYQLSGNTGYLQAAGQVWEFTKEYIIDTKYGEWHEKVHRNGTPYELDKVRSWKCPYHNGRAALEISNRVNSMLDTETELSAGEGLRGRESKINS